MRLGPSTSTSPIYLLIGEEVLGAPSVDETVAMSEGVAAGTITERELADWLRASLN